MKFIIIFLALLLYRYGQIGILFPRFTWFKDYYFKLKTFALRKNLWVNKIAIFIPTLPIVLAIFLIDLLLHPFLFHFLSELFRFCVLIYCLDPDNRLLTLIKLQKNQQNPDYLVLNSQIKSSINTVFSEYFVVLFWFLLLGPVVAVFYRLLLVLSPLLKKEENFQLDHQNETFIFYLEWLPARFMAMGFALMGHFVHCLDDLNEKQLWLKAKPKQLVHEAALSALDFPADQECFNQEEEMKFLQLFERTFMFYIVFLAVIYLF